MSSVIWTRPTSTNNLWCILKEGRREEPRGGSFWLCEVQAQTSE